MNLIIIPVFNDWRSLNKLLLEINKNSNHKNFTQILIIDDNSTIKMLITKQKVRVYIFGELRVNVLAFSFSLATLMKKGKALIPLGKVFRARVLLEKIRQ